MRRKGLLLVLIVALLISVLTGAYLHDVGPSQEALTLAAIANLSARTRENPNDGFLYTQIGMLYARLHRWEDGLKAYRKAAQLSPTSVISWIGLGQTYLHLGQPGKAMRALERAFQLRSGDRELSLELARACLLYRRFSRARELLNGLIQHHPRDPELYVARASLHYAQAKRDEAFADVDQALRLAPELPQAHFMMARLRTLTGKYTEAEKAARKSIRLASSAPDGYVLLADALTKRSWNEQTAREVGWCADKALEIDSRNALGHYFAGFKFMRQGQLRKARQSLMRAREFDPHSAEILFTLGQTLLKLGERSQAQALLERYERIKATEAGFGRLELQAEGNPDPRIHLRLAQLYLDRGMWENATDQVQAVLKSAPKDVAARKLLDDIGREQKKAGSSDDRELMGTF